MCRSRRPLEDRSRTDRKSGANASAVLSVDPSGQVTLRLCTTPNGQGHATVAAQIVADALGLQPVDIDVVTDIDTLTSAWSIASGNYSNRFAAIVVDAIAEVARTGGAQDQAARRRGAGSAIADDIELRDGYARVRGSNKGLPFRKAAARAHWDPAGLPAGAAPGIHETAVVSPPVLGSPDDDDRIASAATFGFVIDLAAVEIDREDRRASASTSMSRCTTSAGSSIRASSRARCTAASCTVSARRCSRSWPTTSRAISSPAPSPIISARRRSRFRRSTIGHVETATPVNALGAKGMGDGSSMLTPAAMANAVADALGRDDIVLPLTRNRVWALANGRDPSA